MSLDAYTDVIFVFRPDEPGYFIACQREGHTPTYDWYALPISGAAVGSDPSLLPSCVRKKEVGRIEFMTVSEDQKRFIFGEDIKTREPTSWSYNVPKEIKTLNSEHPTKHVCLGPNGSWVWVGKDKTIDYSARILPPHLQNQLDKDNLAGLVIRQVAMGKGGSWAVLYQNGVTRSETEAALFAALPGTRASYPRSSTGQGPEERLVCKDKSVCLSLYDQDDFFVQLTDGSCILNCDETFRDSVLKNFKTETDAKPAKALLKFGGKFGAKRQTSAERGDKVVTILKATGKAGGILAGSAISAALGTGCSIM
ncbi:hypothetical protein GLOTRDRAFT_93156 [Gloeophyllum trabeum ATCC 11539]|uniref:Uncharacterized protein n=1 Tax=Gloeophyllum trabeum (strain ATCC 11539 / FP-39264 / Madison 617) TaxID=670483 RepID=S7RM98_GLOTA|nr:uncharacterized protein GLOTRDRAFT_93156 [Gloeophyllum trabeum ATCC 11539]EPQ55530.1 hypothetical protein GLOTRDRAFT_93156 [Gloeophyllum trabeum ATCC 11539]